MAKQQPQKKKKQVPPHAQPVQKKKPIHKGKRRGNKERLADGTLVVYERRSFFWRVFAFLLAFILGAGAAVGTLVGVGYWAGYNVPVQDVLGMFSSEYQNLLREEKAQLSLFGLIEDLATNEWNSLADIDEYTPLLRDLLEQANAEGELLDKYGITLDVDELLQVSFADLPSYLQTDVIYAMELGGLFSVTASSTSLMIALCYGKEGEDFLVNENGEIVMMEGKSPTTLNDVLTDSTVISSIELGVLLEVTPSSGSLPIGICYGQENVNFAIENGKFVDLDETDIYPATVDTIMRDAETLISNLTLEAALGVTATTNEMMRALAYGTEGVNYEIVQGEVKMLVNPDTGMPYPKHTIAELTGTEITFIDDMTVGALAGIDVNDPDTGALMKEIASWTLKELKDSPTEKFEAVSIGTLVEIDATSPLLLQAISEWTVKDLQNTHRIERLKLKQLIAIDENASPLMQTMGDWRISDFTDPDAINSLRLSEVIEIQDTDPIILQKLAKSAIGDLATAVDALVLGDVLEGNSLDSNKILSHLKNVPVTDLATALNEITIGEVFTDEIYTYTTQSHYDAQVAASEPIIYSVFWSETKIQAYYTDGVTELEKGYFYQAVDGSYLRIDEFTTAYEIRTPVDVTRTYQKYDYETGNLEELSATEQSYLSAIQTDSAGNEYIVVEGERVDLEGTNVFFYQNTATPLPADAIVAFNQTLDCYELIEESPVAEYYYAYDAAAEAEGYELSALREKSAVTARYRAKEDIEFAGVTGNIAKGEELIPFADGMWWVILNYVEDENGDPVDVLNTPILEISKIFSEMTSTIDKITLNDLYLHNLISEKPTAAIGGYTISQLIEFANGIHP